MAMASSEDSVDAIHANICSARAHLRKALSLVNGSSYPNLQSIRRVLVETDRQLNNATANLPWARSTE